MDADGRRLKMRGLESARVPACNFPASRRNPVRRDAEHHTRGRVCSLSLHLRKSASSADSWRQSGLRGILTFQIFETGSNSLLRIDVGKIRTRRFGAGDWSVEGLVAFGGKPDRDAVIA
jgi:hypothetical protein